MEPDLYYFLVTSGCGTLKGVDKLRPQPPLRAEFGLNSRHQVVLMSPLGLEAPATPAWPREDTRATVAVSCLPHVAAAWAPPRHHTNSGVVRADARLLLCANQISKRTQVQNLQMMLILLSGVVEKTM